MKQLEQLFDRIVQRVNINLREHDFDARPFVNNLVPSSQMKKFYAFYGITPHHKLNFQFRNANMAGSYFLGKCQVNDSLLYKSDIRGDELKKKGDRIQYGKFDVPVHADEEIKIDDSFLIKTLVHNNSHDPETLEKFFIRSTIAAHYANIHGAPIDGSFLGPFATVDLTTVQDCVVGTFSYVQVGEASHLNVPPGTIWVRSPGVFNFLYRHPEERLKKYIHFAAGSPPEGVFIDFAEERKAEFERIFNVVTLDTSVPTPDTASLDRFAVVRPKTHIDENVLVSQRAYLENAFMGKGANAQESCYIINSRLEGFDVTAHGAKIIESDLSKNVFVGFNSFLRGRPDARLSIGEQSVVMPHTIIDIREPLSIPGGTLVWGLVENEEDLAENSISLEEFSKVRTTMNRGRMIFEGNAEAFVTAFKARIHHILEENGAFFDGDDSKKGHAQRNQNISFNMIQPYPDGDEKEGLYPNITIMP